MMIRPAGLQSERAAVALMIPLPSAYPLKDCTYESRSFYDVVVHITMDGM